MNKQPALKSHAQLSQSIGPLLGDTPIGRLFDSVICHRRCAMVHSMSAEDDCMAKKFPDPKKILVVLSRPIWKSLGVHMVDMGSFDWLCKELTNDANLDILCLDQLNLPTARLVVEERLGRNANVFSLKDVLNTYKYHLGSIIYGNMPFLEDSIRIQSYLKTHHYDQIIFEDFNAVAFIPIRNKRMGLHFSDTEICVLFGNCGEYRRSQKGLRPEKLILEAKTEFAERYCCENGDRLLAFSPTIFDWAVENDWRLEKTRCCTLQPQEHAFWEDASTGRSFKFQSGGEFSKYDIDQQPLVSVCVPHFNDSGNLAWLLQSLSKNAYGNFEIIVVDDGSTNQNDIESIKQLKESYSTEEEKIRFEFKVNEGPGKTRNYAASLAKGDFLIFMDSDNLATPDMISLFVHAMRTSDADCLTCWFASFDKNYVGLRPEKFEYTYAPLGACIEVAPIDNVLGDTNFCIKREVFLSLGGFISVRGFGLEDWHFLIRLVLEGFKLDVVPVELLYYRLNDTGWNKASSSFRSIQILHEPLIKAIPKNMQRLINNVLIPALSRYERAEESDRSAISFGLNQELKEFFRKHAKLKKTLIAINDRMARVRMQIYLTRFLLHIQEFKRRLVGLKLLKAGDYIFKGFSRLFSHFRAYFRTAIKYRWKKFVSIQKVIRKNQTSNTIRPDKAAAWGNLSDESLRRYNLSEIHAKQIVLCLNHLGYDFLTVTHNLEAETSQIGDPFDKHFVAREDVLELLRKGVKIDQKVNFLGRQVKLLPGEKTICLLEQNILGFSIETESNQIYLHTVMNRPANRAVEILNSEGIEFIPKHVSKKPVIFILPTFLALGGVERNTLAIVKELSAHFDFVVINFVSLASHQGSMHKEFENTVTGIYDLAELGPSEAFVPMLKSLKKVYSPSLIWICNGCPWLGTHLREIRDIFNDAPIVDQQVYDTNEGWINLYGLREIHAFDRFIAVNHKIADVFSSRYNISYDKIDIIYSAILSNSFEPRKKDISGNVRNKQHKDFPTDRPVFAFIGRFAPQKRPDGFVSLATWMKRLGDDSCFIMIGDGPLARTIKDLKERNRLDNLQLLGFRNDLENIYPYLSGLIITSEYEGLPITLLEALACGIPAYSTDVGGISRILEDYGSGVTVPYSPMDKAFADCFLLWKKRLDSYKKAAWYSRTLIRKRFSTEEAAKKYFECWNKAYTDRCGKQLINSRQPMVH